MLRAQDGEGDVKCKPIGVGNPAGTWCVRGELWRPRAILGIVRGGVREECFLKEGGKILIAKFRKQSKEKFAKSLQRSKNNISHGEVRWKEGTRGWPVLGGGYCLPRARNFTQKRDGGRPRRMMIGI